MNFKCKFCKSNDIENKIVYQHEKLLTFYLCKCGVWQQLNPPSNKDIEKFFNSSNFYKNEKKYKVEGYSDYFLEEENRKKTSRFRLLKISKYINFKNLNNVLKIGCSTGTFLFYLKQKYNCNVMGVDLSKKFCDFAKKNYDIDVINKDYMKVNYNNLDMILLFNVIENVPDIDNFLNKIFSDLNYGGYFIVNYVDADNFLLKLTKKSYFMFRPPVYYIFNKLSFEQLVYKYGFKKEFEFLDIRHFTLEKILLLLNLSWINKFFYFITRKINFKIYAYPSKIVIFKKCKI